ncbi:MAG: single-stranded-DNA-specific exonuclease RecJ [Candidatus Tectomicrobia bacterium]|uniref:Single-stranded-DNA-specific exonuclease RecJ n=1 Tax=Tectimicrobiota bacterium TaxID=2528274 RepID=A0A937VZC4_UNCTE|nr:single-stranded-DNA-specific exonuclease RecJ [Candidatus Tectomicrobia bacterium]
MRAQWHVAEADAIARHTLAAATGLSPLLCQVLLNRGLTEAAAVQRFLSPSLHDLYDPYDLHGMTQAVQRLVAALQQGEQIAIYGDYDVDGITATALLVTFFEELGLQVPYYIPERASEGYGLNASSIQHLARAGTQLLITVDCGSTALEEVALARRLGMDVVITDHHQPPAQLPDACAVLNPHQPACTYPNKHLCGVGVVFKLLTALRAALRQEPQLANRLPNLKRHLDFTALGTIADVMPLRDENRVMVHYGLQELTQTRKIGLQALRQVSGRADKPAGVGEVGFQLAPRLNASGRLGSATHSVALLLARETQDATRLAQMLDTVNQERRTLQQAMEDEVHARIAQQYKGHPPEAIVLGDPAWHPGVVGIVAAKVVEAYHRPTFLLHINGDTARGSGRSIPAFNLYEGLQHCARWLRQFGGHKYAAGLTMDVAHLPALQEDLIRFAADTLTPADLLPTLHLDAVVALEEMTPALVAELERCEPYGTGNPVPVFCAQGVQLASPIRLLGQQGQHARFRVTQHGVTLGAVAFQQAAQAMTLPPDAVLDIAFTPTINTWREQRTLELHLRAFRLHTPGPQGESH